MGIFLKALKVANLKRWIACTLWKSLVWMQNAQKNIFPFFYSRRLFNRTTVIIILLYIILYIVSRKLRRQKDFFKRLRMAPKKHQTFQNLLPSL